MNNNTGEILTGKKSDGYSDYTIMTFPNWKALNAFAKNVYRVTSVAKADEGNEYFFQGVRQDFAEGKFGNYGLFDKWPVTIEEALERKDFVYFDEYKAIKDGISQQILNELLKNSEAEAMKPKLVFNDRELGEFVFDRAAMSLEPELYYYSPIHKREIDAIKEPVAVKDNGGLYLEKDGSLVVMAMKVELPDGKIEYIPAAGDESIKEASSKGIVGVTSTNKKTYLFKEKRPKINNAVKIIVGLTNGGFTNWLNDFYTGVAAGIAIEFLESLGYSVQVEVAVGGGRCTGCRKAMNTTDGLSGRRFFTFTAKTFDDPLDLNELLYTIADPSFHTIKFISLLNYFFAYFGDEIVNNSPSDYWHGIQEDDMVNPIGMYHRKKDLDKGNDNILYFYMHKVPDAAGVVEAVKNIVLTAENNNLKLLEKIALYDFSE